MALTPLLRVGEIQQKTDIDSWHHLASEENMSDILTHGAPPNMISTGSVWKSGPSWLLNDFCEWPLDQTFLQDTPEVEEEIIKFQSKSAKVKNWSYNKGMLSKTKTLEITKSKSLELNYISSLVDVETLCARRSNLDSVLIN